MPAELFEKPFRFPEIEDEEDHRALVVRARELLRAAGWFIVDGVLSNPAGEIFEMEFLTRSPSEARTRLPYFQRLEQLGIRARMAPASGDSEWINRLRQFRCDAALVSVMPMTAATHVLPFDAASDETPVDLDTVGGKGMSLARMAIAGLPVPPGFTVATSAYRKFVTDSGLQQALLEHARPQVVGKTASFKAASERIQALFAGTPPSDELKNEISAAYPSLGRGEPPVAVRSPQTPKISPTCPLPANTTPT